MTATAVLVVVPTTGGPLVIRTLRPRQGLPASTAFAEGDYRPLPWSGDYARLAAPGGPLDVPAPHELRLSGSFDTGRSWEAPVCLAHGLLAQGYRLVGEPGAADLVVWATGAVDLDLAVLPGDYALLDKIERSRVLLAAAPGADLAVLLPAGPECAEAERTLTALDRARPLRVLPAAAVPAALAALAAEPAPAAELIPTVAPSVRPRRFALPVAAAAGLAAIALGVVSARAPAPEPSAPVPGASAPGPSPTDNPVSESPAPVPREAAAEPSAKPGDEPGAGGAPAVLVEELVAPAGSSCRRVVFGADPPERRPVRAEAEGRLHPSRLAPDLCGLAFSARSGLRVEVGPELRAAALPPSPLPGGAQAYFLREAGRRNLVYAAQAVPEAGPAPPGDRLTHALVR